MGWKGGLKLIIRPAAGAAKAFDVESHHVDGRRLLVDISGVLHKAVRRGARQVALTGTSSEAEQYVYAYLDGIFQMGAIAVPVFDGCAYPPKKATQASRQRGRAEARAEAEALEAASKPVGKAWQRAAGVFEPFNQAIMSHCVRRGIEFIVAPYEADSQLVACLEAGQGDCILVASDDSDIIALGAADCLYNFDPVARTAYRVGIFDILGKVVGEFSFEQWTYDRFVVFCILCSCDFLDNIPNMGLKRVHGAMGGAKLPSDLLVPPNQPHPPLQERPTHWRTPDALRAYMEPVLRAGLKSQQERDDWAASVLQAYHAMRHHPVFRPYGMDTSLAHASLAVGIATPLEAVAPGQSWEQLISGLQLHGSADDATAHARGLLRADTGLPRSLVTTAVGADDDSEDGSDGGGQGRPQPAADAHAARTPDLDATSVETATAGELRSWLINRAGLEPYKRDSDEKLRSYVRQLLREGVPPVLAPAHPLLGALTRTDPHLRPLGPQQLRGAACWEVAKRLATQHGLKITEDLMARFLPFAGTRERGAKLYYGSRGSRTRAERPWGYAHVPSLSVQRATYSPPGRPVEQAFAFRMKVLFASLALFGVAGTREPPTTLSRRSHYQRCTRR